MPDAEFSPDTNPSHIVSLSFPGIDANEDWIRVNTDPEAMETFLSDEAHFPGGSSSRVISVSPEAAEAEVSCILRQLSDEEHSVVVIGSQTSITGASVPFGNDVLSLANMKGCRVDEEDRRGTVTVQPGVTFSQLEESLAGSGLFLPPGPTYTEATVIGAISTNASGARSYKYGSMRNYVQGLKVVLASGELLEMERGQYIASPADEESPGGYFILQGEGGEEQRLSIPSYTLPDIPKISAGYYAKPGIDLVDLFVGSEGTLGVITEATLDVIKEPPTFVAVVQCETDEQAIELIELLADPSTPERLTETISAVEYLGSKAVALVQANTSLIPSDSNGAMLFVQVEGNEDSVMRLAETCQDLDIDTDKILLAEPYDTARKEEFIAMREAAPITVNELIQRQSLISPAITKIGSDPSVRQEDIGRMAAIYEELFGEIGLDYYVWGHGEGNFHYNMIPTTPNEVSIAKLLILKAGERVIQELHGSGMAEHGVGKNPIKKALLRTMYGETGVQEMIRTKLALDPHKILAPGNIFDF